MIYFNIPVRREAAKRCLGLKGCAFLNAFILLSSASAYALTENPIDEALGDDSVAYTGDPIVVNNDIPEARGHSLKSGSDLTIDFNNHVYSAYGEPAGSSGTKTQLFQLIKGSTVLLKNGTLNVSDDAPDDFKMLIQNYSDLTLDNMVLDGSNLIGTSPYPYVLSNNSGTVNVKNSTIIAKAGGTAFDVYYWHPYYPDGVNFTLDGSTVKGNIEVTGNGENIPEYSKLYLNNENTIEGNILNDGSIYVNGQLNYEGTITGSGVMTFADGSKLKTAVDNATALISGNTVTGTTALVLENGADEAELKLFGSEQSGFTLTNTLYDVSTTDNKTWQIVKKSTSSIVDEFVQEGINSQQAETISAFADSKSENAVLNGITELAQNGHVKEAGKMAEEVAPTTSQAVIGISEGINNVLNNAVAARISKIGQASGDAFVGGSVWAQGLINHAKQDSTSSVQGFDADTMGLSFGVDGKINDAWLIGLGYGYTKTDADSGERNIDVDAHNFFAYTEYKPDNWYVNGMFSYGLNKYEEKKIAGLKAKYDVDTYAANVMTGYDFDNGITPEAGLRYLLADQEAYNDGVQHIKADKTDVLTGVLGVKYQTSMFVGDLLVKPAIRVAATYDMISDDSKANVVVIGGGAYQINGKRLERFGVELGAGVKTTYQDWDFSVDYNGGFRKDFQSHTGMLKAKYNF